MNVNTHPVAPPFQFTYSQHLHVQNILLHECKRSYFVSFDKSYRSTQA